MYYCWTKEPPALLEHTVLKQTNVSEARFVRRYDEEKEVVDAIGEEMKERERERKRCVYS